MSADLTPRDIVAARRAIAGIAATTPLVPSAFLGARAGGPVLLKLETTQPVGAFKLRGAANALAGLGAGVKGVTCCSTGNHGRGVAYAARARGLRAVIFMSSLVPQTKIDGIKALDGEVRITGADQDQATAESRRLAAEEDLVEISPFDHPLVIAGQGTIGFELYEQDPDIATIVVPLSGGGLAGGIALAAKAINPKARLVGVSMDRGAAMYESLRAGAPVEVKEVASLADSLGGGIGLDNKLSFALCRDTLDETVLVSEEEIYRAMQALYYEERIVCEGGAAVGVAALLAGRLGRLRPPVAIILSGRNVDMGLFTDIINGRDVSLGDRVVKGAAYGP